MSVFSSDQEAGWLIELLGHVPHMWLYIDLEAPVAPAWTTDAGAALRFARKIDAQNACRFFRLSEKVIFTEHIWSKEPHDA